MSNEKREQNRREDCRLAVLEHLHDRNTVAQDASTITRYLRTRKGHDFELHEVESACSFLVSDQFLFEHREALGASRHYQITAAGSREYERRLV